MGQNGNLCTFSFTTGNLCTLEASNKRQHGPCCIHFEQQNHVTLYHQMQWSTKMCESS